MKELVWKTRRLDVAKNMPSRRHSIQGQVYDVRNSEVVQWLTEQPDILQLLFNMAANRKLIQYDPETGTWCGIDYAD